MRDGAFPSDLAAYGEVFATTPLKPKWVLQCLGIASLASAGVGVIMPLWPTTPFLLLAGWAFARSSPRLDAWLNTHARFGPLLLAWRERGAIPRSAKVAAGASLSASWAGLWMAQMSSVALVGSGLMLACVGLWLFSRPS